MPKVCMEEACGAAFDRYNESCPECGSQAIGFVHDDDPEDTVDTSDAVNHPSHYMRIADLLGVECIEVIEALELNYLVGNALKYIWRAGAKGNYLQDLKKARWYLDREIENKETT